MEFATKSILLYI